MALEEKRLGQSDKITYSCLGNWEVILIESMFYALIETFYREQEIWLPRLTVVIKFLYTNIKERNIWQTKEDTREVVKVHAV